VPVVIGGIFILCILLLRQGIVGELKNFVRSRSERHGDSAKDE
jgi:ABC-type branched-subunit amino acid transport system permease subunit